MAATSPTMTAGVPELKTKSTFSQTCIKRRGFIEGSKTIDRWYS